jgi:hypothetical protein
LAGVPLRLPVEGSKDSHDATSLQLNVKVSSPSASAAVGVNV